MTKRNRRRYEQIEQAPEPPVIDHEIRYQGTRIEPGKPKRLKLRKGSKTVILKQPRRREIGLVYIPSTDTILEVSRVVSNKFTSSTPPVGDFPQIRPGDKAMRDLSVTQKPTKPRRPSGGLTTHYQVEKKPTRSNRMAKSYDTRVQTYWGPPTRDHPAVKKKLGKIRAPR